MTTLYIIRHAEAEGNLYRRIHGWYDSLITENGYRQIAALERRFREIPVDAVYSSDLFRTQTTAGAVWRPKGLRLNLHPGLREVSMGGWEDRPWGEVEQTDRARLAAFSSSDPAWQVEGGETFAMVGRRMVETVREIAAAHPGETVALFSHGTAIRTMLAEFLHLSQGEMGRLGHCDNTGVACLQVEKDAVNVLSFNDNSHLSDEISTLARQNWWKAKGSAPADTNLWYQPLDLKQEGDYYLSCREQAWRDVHGTLEGCDAQKHLRRARECAARGEWTFRAMLGRESVGVLELDPRHARETGAGWISLLYLVPEHRGKGLGVQLIGQAVSVFRAQGREKLRLVCAQDNLAAQRLYERHGFRKIGQEDGAFAPLNLLEKDIGYEPRYIDAP